MAKNSITKDFLIDEWAGNSEICNFSVFYLTGIFICFAVLKYGQKKVKR